MNQFTFDFQKQPGRTRTRFHAPDPKDALISIITPYYNAGKFFEQTFNSVMNQTFPWFEWIIVNDGSTNQEDVDILQKFATMDPRITVVDQENGGQSRARNKAIEHSKTEYIVPLDADDLIDATFLEILYWTLQYNPDASWCYSDSLGFYEQEYLWKHPFDSEVMKRENLLTATAMIRRKDFLRAGGYRPEKYLYHEDWRLWLDMLALGMKPVHVNEPLFWYRRMKSGMLTSTNTDAERAKFTIEIINKAAANIKEPVQAKEYPVGISHYPFYTASMNRWDRKQAQASKAIKALWLIPWMQMGGADKFNLDAIAGLEKNGIKNYIVTTQPCENEWRQKFEDYTDEIFNLPNFLDPAHYVEFISYYIQSRDIDVIMLSNSYDGYYMMPWIRQHFPDVAIVDYVHMEEWYWLAGGFARTSGILAGITEKTYVCNSRTRNVIIKKFNRKPENVDCLYIGVDHQQFSQDKEEAGYLHNMLNLPEDRPIVLFPCRIHPQKRPFIMLDIAEGVRKLIPNVAFVVAGDGPQLNELQAQITARQLDNTVYCIGSTNHMRSCYRDSALTLICSLKEGLALTAYESCSMGVPVVSADVGGQGDLVGFDVGALLPLRQREEDIDLRIYDPEEIEDYVSNICRILQDKNLYAQLSANCRRKIEEGFSIEKMVASLTRELTELCTDATKRVQRHAVSAALNMMDNLATDYYTIYQQWAISRDRSEAIWNARCWFEEEYNKSQQALEEARNLSFKTLVYLLLRKIKQHLMRIFA